MPIHDGSDAPFGEPEDGWVTATTTFQTNEILTAMLCIYTAEKPTVVDAPDNSVLISCAARAEHRHEDVDCFMNFYSTVAITEGIIPTDRIALMVSRDPAGDIVYSGVVHVDEQS